MADIGTITAILANLKTATDIARAIKDLDLSLERAELKGRLADVLVALADAKIEVTEIQDVLKEKDRRIAELEEAFNSKDSLVRYADGYYVKNDGGKPSGSPLCLTCWDVEHKQSGLRGSVAARTQMECIRCTKKYDKHRVPTLPAEGPPAS